MQLLSKIKTIFNLHPKSKIDNNPIAKNAYSLIRFRESISILVLRSQPLVQFPEDSILPFKLNPS